MSHKSTLYEKYVKRTIDLILSMFAIVVLSPIMLIIAIGVKYNMGSPVIFGQRRVGYNEKVFTIYKFRTMNDKKDENNKLLPDEMRITKFGRFLRKTSLDELPQLVNIIKGEIAIIGPRPLLVDYLPIYTEEEHMRHSVRPGLVGLAGVNGRNNQSWDSKFRYDKEYVDNISFKLDIGILLKCVKIVLGQKDIYCEEEKLRDDSFVKRVKELIR